MLSFIFFDTNELKTIIKNKYQVNMFSTDVHKELPKSSMSKSFIEWFVGLCDAESNLSVGKRLNEKKEVSGFEFVFR